MKFFSPNVCQDESVYNFKCLISFPKQILSIQLLLFEMLKIQYAPWHTAFVLHAGNISCFFQLYALIILQTDYI